MPSCVIKNCKNCSQKQKQEHGLSFHKFPAEAVLRDEWVSITRKSRQDDNWMPSKFCVICSSHFKEEDFYFTEKGRRLIKKGSKPTQNLHAPLSSPKTLDAATESLMYPSTEIEEELDHDNVVESLYRSPTSSVPTTTEISLDEKRLTYRVEQLTQLARQRLVKYKNLQKRLKRKLSELEHSGTSASKSVAGSSKAKATKSRASPDVETDAHEDFRCNECAGKITGFRYTCVQCTNYDLCAKCESLGAHDLHYVLRIPGPRPYLEVQSMLQRIRMVLPREADYSEPDEPEDDDVNIADSVKVEPNDEADAEPDPLQIVTPDPHIEDEPSTSNVPKKKSILDKAMEEIKIEYESDDEYATEVSSAVAAIELPKTKPYANKPSASYISSSTTLQKPEYTTKSTSQKRQMQQRVLVPQKRPHLEIDSRVHSVDSSAGPQIVPTATRVHDPDSSYNVFTHNTLLNFPGIPAGVDDSAAAVMSIKKELEEMGDD